MKQAIAADVDYRCEGNTQVLACRGDARNPRAPCQQSVSGFTVKNLHPIHLFHMSEAKNELVDNSICTDRPADEFKCCIVGITEDEVIEIKMAETGSSNTTS
jgi:hypothetical protein